MGDDLVLRWQRVSRLGAQAVSWGWLVAAYIAAFASGLCFADFIIQERDNIG